MITIIEELEKTLEPIASNSGKLFNTPLSNLENCKYFFMGINPGGDPETECTIQEDIDFIKSHPSFYDMYEGIWDTDAGQSPIQKGFRELIEFFEISKNEICATNWYFSRSRKYKEIPIGTEEISKNCIELLLSKLKPNVIITHGNPPKEKLLGLLDKVSKRKSHSSGHGNNSFNSYETFYGSNKQLGTIAFVSLPHLRYFRPKNYEKKLSKAKFFLKPHYVYVIELEEDVLDYPKFTKENPNYMKGMPCVYVGYSSEKPEIRFDKHRNAATNKKGHKIYNTYAHDYGFRLLPEQYESLNPILSVDVAKAMEKEKARLLRDQGWGVWQK